MAEVVDSAVELALQFGWRLFGVAADCRSPIKVTGEFEHGCHDATRDLGEIRRRWRDRHPNANVAVACGPGSGVWVCDLDRKGGVDGFASIAALEALNSPVPTTVTALTPSGGEHRYYSWPDGWDLMNKVGLKVYHSDGSCTRYPGIDFRVAGGSAALPPSRKPHGAYTWKIPPGAVPFAAAPRWLLQLGVAPPPPKINRQPLRLSTADKTARYVAAAVNGECGDLAGMKANTGRNLKLFQAAANLGELVGAALLPLELAEDALECAAADCGLLKEDGPNSIRATIASGLRRGMSKPREVSL